MLKSPRLVLRRIVAADASVLWSWRVHREIVRSLPAPTLNGLRAFVRETLQDRSRHQFMAVAGGEPIGLFRLYERGLSDRDIGGLLAKPAWGLGYGTEVARVLLDYGFRRLKLHRIWATCDVDNARSIHLMKKIGMKREGRMREHRLLGGRWRDSLLFAILDSEWKAKP